MSRNQTTAIERRVILIGPTGAGKSWLGNKLVPGAGFRMSGSS